MKDDERITQDLKAAAILNEALLKVRIKLLEAEAELESLQVSHRYELERMEKIDASLRTYIELVDATIHTYAQHFGADDN